MIEFTLVFSCPLVRIDIGCMANQFSIVSNGQAELAHEFLTFVEVLFCLAVVAAEGIEDVGIDGMATREDIVDGPGLIVMGIENLDMRTKGGKESDIASLPFELYDFLIPFSGGGRGMLSTTCLSLEVVEDVAFVIGIFISDILSSLNVSHSECLFIEIVGKGVVRTSADALVIEDAKTKDVLGIVVLADCLYGVVIYFTL